MLSHNGELNAKFDALYQDHQELKKPQHQMSEQLVQIQVILENITANGLEDKGKDRATVSGSSGAPPSHSFMYSNQRMVEDPQLIDVDRGTKQEVPNFMGDHDPEVFFACLHSLESFFCWHQMTEERKLLFVEANLEVTARIWWAKYQREHCVSIHTWEDMKIAMNHYFMPTSYKQRAHLQFTQLTQGSKSMEEYIRLFYSLATRSEFPWNEDVMIFMYR